MSTKHYYLLNCDAVDGDALELNNKDFIAKSERCYTEKEFINAFNENFISPDSQYLRVVETFEVDENENEIPIRALFVDGKVKGIMRDSDFQIYNGKKWWDESNVFFCTFDEWITMGLEDVIPFMKSHPQL